MSQIRSRGQYGPAKVGGQDLPGFRQERASIRKRRPIPMRRSHSSSITGGGPACRFTSEPVSACRNASPISRFSFTRRRLGLFTQETKGGLSEARPNLLVLRIQPEEGISLRFFRRAPAAACAYGRFRWISITVRASANARLPLMKRCWWMRWRATRRFIRGRTWWMRVGRLCSPFWISGPILSSIFPTMRPAVGGRKLR